MGYAMHAQLSAATLLALRFYILVKNKQTNKQQQKQNLNVYLLHLPQIL